MKLKDILHESKSPLPAKLKAITKEYFKAYVEPVFDDFNDSGLDIKIADLNGRTDGFIPFYDGGMNISLTIPASQFFSSGSFPKVIKSDLEEIESDLDGDDEEDDGSDLAIIADVTVSIDKEEITVGGGFEDERGKPFNKKSYVEETFNIDASDEENTKQQLLIAINKVLTVFK